MQIKIYFPQAHRIFFFFFEGLQYSETKLELDVDMRQMSQSRRETRTSLVHEPSEPPGSPEDFMCDSF